MAKESGSGSTGLLQGLRNSPATQQLKDQAREFAQARSQRLLSGVGDKVANVGKSVDQGDGKATGLGTGAKKLMQGDGPAKAGLGAATSGLKEKVKGLVGKGQGGGKGRSGIKATDIEESIDVGVPVSVAYNQWTQFQEFSQFMKGVEGVEQTSDTETNWRVKVFKSRRTWKATVQEQVPDYRIVWTSEGAKGSTKGVVTFHELGENLTRVLLTMEYYPQGLFEKTGNLWRAGGRRARLDLKNFRRFLAMRGEATGEWRGEVHDGQVVPPEEQEQSDQQDRRQRSDGSKEQHGSKEQNGSKQQDGSRRQHGSKQQQRSEQGDRSDGDQRSRNGRSRDGQGRPDRNRDASAKQGPAGGQRERVPSR
ncbi:MAG: SRPBCC family protein [Jatrophihabitans sp.]|uniref:SRPBCC family protein n=1 Tax=Jatrophihabitans sp. TaxID=1932789 RepID=UPI003F7D2FAE